MPKKITLADLRGGAPSWAQPAYEKNVRATERVDAAIAEIVQDGVAISEEQRQKAIKDFMETGDFDLTATEVPVEQTAETTPVLPSKGPSVSDYLSDLATTFLGRRAISSASETLTDIKAEQYGLTETPTAPTQTPRMIALGLTPAAFEQTPEVKAVLEERRKERAPALQQERTKLEDVIKKRTQQIAGAEERLPAPSRTVAKVSGELAGQPAQALPTIGGIAGSFVSPGVGTTIGAGLGSLPVAKDAFEGAYVEAREQFKATDEEARLYATLITGIEFGTETLGGVGAGLFTKGLKSFGVKSLTKEAIQQGLTKTIAGRTGRILGAAASEGLEEIAAEAGGDVVREVIQETGALSTEEARSALATYNAKQAADRYTRLIESGVGGALMGGAISTPIAIATHAAEQGRQASGTITAAQEGYRAQTRRAREQTLEDVKTDTELNEDIRLEQERIAQERAKEDAFTKAEQDRAKAEEQAARQKEIEEEAGFRTIETEREFQGKTRVERAGDTLVERIPINPPAETTPEQVQAEREQAAANEAARVERVELGGLTEQLRKRKENLAKKGAEQQAKDDRQAKSAETRRQRVVMDQLIAENPDADPADLAPLLRNRLATAAPVAPVTEQAAPAVAEAVTATVDEKATTPDKKAPDSELDTLTKQLGLEDTVPDKDLDDEGVRKLAEAAGIKTKPVDPTLNAAPTKTAANPKGEAFEPRLKRFIKGLVRANTQPTADVQNLFRQKKLIAAPNPESIGRNDTGAASYDPATGQMYIYLDRIDVDKGVAGLAKALHEATHTGQYNDREGRPSILKQMMGNKKYSAAEKLIRDNYGKNTLATAAVDKARADTKARGGDDSVEHLEVVPYFVSEATKARQGFGRLGGLVADIKAAGRGFLRDKLKVDLDISLDELNAASQRVAGEIVKTEVQQSDGRGGTLNIIGGRNAIGFDEARTKGETFTEEADAKERFEIPDYEAELVDSFSTEGTSAYRNLLDGYTLSLEKFLDHVALYKNYPTLKTLKLKVAPLDGSYAQYTSGNRTVTLDRNQVIEAFDTGNTEFLRQLVLHEVQHAVQDIEGFSSGASKSAFMPRGVVNSFNDTKRARERAIEQFDINRAIAELPFDIRKAWDLYVNFAGYTTEQEKAVGFMTNQEFVNSTKSPILKQQAQMYYNATDNYNKAATKYNEAESQAYRKYLTNLGEAEARNTEQRSRMTPEQIKASPARTTLLQDPLSKAYKVERPELMSERGRKQEAAAEVAPTLNAAPDITNERRWVPQIVTRLFDSKQGTSSEIGEIVEFAASSPAEARMIAEASLSKYDVALKNEAKRRGTTPEQLNEQITAELEAVDKAENSYEQNKAAFTAVASKYGQAGQSLIDMRNQIDDLTMEILRQRAAQNKPLTDKEKKLYQTLRNNMGRYTHRQYAVNAGKMGDRYSKEIWKAYEKVKTGRRHNAKDLANFQRVSDAVKYLVDNKLYIPDNEGLANMSAERMRSLYDVWGSVGNPEGMSIDAMKDELATIRDTVNGDKGRLEAAAESITQELLGLMPPQKALTNYFRGGKENRAILKERQSIPPEIRKLMGEITDPSMRLMLTAAKQAEFVARNKMLLELTQQTGKDIQPPNAAGTPAAKGMQRLTGETWGPMEGYYVSDNMRALVGDVVQQIATFEQALALAAARPGSLIQKVIAEGTNKFGKVAGVSKVMQIVGNPINFIYNWVGAWRMLLSNGNISLKNVAKAHKVSSELIAYAISPATATKEAIRMNKYGITDSAFIGELKGAQYQQLGRLIKAMTGKTHTQAMATLRDAGVGAKELYAMMDVWSKIGNFYHQVDVLTDFYKAEGTPRTEEQINREAANKVNATNITYKRAAPLIKDLERGGITQFGTYFYEVFRSEISNFMMGLEELAVANRAETPEGRRIMTVQSAKRLTGQTLSWALTAALAKSLGEMAFGDDEEEESYLRSLLPDFMQNQDFWPIGKDKDGNIVLFNVARLDPVGPITDIMRTMMQEDADLEAVGKNLFDLYIAPRVGTQILTALAATFSDDIRPSREPTTKQLAPGLWSDISQLSPAADRVDRAWANVLESFMPGIVTSWRETNVHPEMHNAGDIVPAISSYLGASMYKLDPKKAAKFTSMDYGDVLKNARKDVKEIFDDHPEGLPTKQLAARINELEAKEHEEFDKVVRVYRGMLATGMSPREAAAVFKDMRLAGDVITDVKNGEFNSRVISEDSLKQYETRELQGANRAEQKEIKAKWKMIYNMLDKAQEEK